MKIIIAVALSLISILCTFQAVSANDLFYSGDIVIDSIAISADIGDQEATVSAVYVLGNRGTETEEIYLEYGYSPASLQVDGETLENPVVFFPGDRKSVTVNFKINTTGETTKTLSLEPNLLFNGNMNSEPAALVTIKTLLPAGINGLAWVSQEPDEISIESGRKIYSWEDVDVYPTQLTLKWSTLAIELAVEKSASPAAIMQQNQVINIEITLTNNGDTELSDIRLVDQYAASHFGEIEPSVESSTLENLVFWQKTINSLGPGETIKLNYSVKYIWEVSQVHDFELKPAVVTVGGNLVSVSNEVRMKLETEPPSFTIETQIPAETGKSPMPEPESEEEASGDSSWPAAMYIGIPVLVLAVISAGYILFRRKPAK